MAGQKMMTGYHASTRRVPVIRRKKGLPLSAWAARWGGPGLRPAEAPACVLAVDSDGARIGAARGLIARPALRRRV